VQIELWLLGSDIDLQQERRYACNGIRKRSAFDPLAQPDPVLADFYDPDGELEARMREYYHEFCGIGKAKARRLAKTIRPSLFQSFLNPHHEQVPADAEPLAQHDVYETVLGQIKNTSQAEKLLTTGRSLGLRIWDGLKRIWRWFKRRILKVIKFGKNLARAFYRYASKGFTIVQRAIRAVVSSVKHYQAGRFVFAGVSVQLGKDFDTRLFAPPAAPPKQLHQAGERLQLFGARFRFAGRILGLIFSTFVLSSMQRWARLAMSLAAELKQLIPLYHELIALEARLPTSMC
jgi:hypothetical protein